MSSPFKLLLNAPTSYIREDDEAEMVEVAPHRYVSRRALANICNPASPQASVAAPRKARSKAPNLLLAD